MNTGPKQNNPRGEQATKAAHRLMETGNPPESAKIRDAALECFEAGVPAAANELLTWFSGHEAIAKSAWFLRLKSWLDTAVAKQWLNEKPTHAKPLFVSENSKEIRDLAHRLRSASQFGLSRRLLARLAGERPNLLAEFPADAGRTTALARTDLGDNNYREIVQELSLSTYKDLDIDPARALADAERLLDGIGLHAADCADPETLGQGGAIYKRRSELTGRMEHLQQSLAFYRRGWEARDTDGKRCDGDAYCGGNAAFVLDLLAKRVEDFDAEQAKAWREEARILREALIAELEQRTDQKQWTLASLADGYFALGNYGKAREYYARASAAIGDDWQRKTMFLQAVQLARARNISLPDADAAKAGFNHPAWNAMQPILGGKTASALAGFRPKTGLALSGGGFRAAFYHLGVLARLADLDALRHVEVISTVSGGSIVGTHYFLMLKTLLETRGDDVTAQDYRRLVRQLIGEFRAGVEMNLRMRAFVSLRALWRMLWRLDYNQTLRLGELYDEYFYARVPNKKTTLRDLIVSPKGEGRDFSPRQDNWLRRAKVPILLINATNLNSGHSWQFAGSFMGEPPGLLEAEIDANERYARVHLDQAHVSREWREFSLGSAVAASSAVPGLFNPVPLAGLYEERDVQLADGGIYDNQGVDTLLQENCSLILCSDASGQLGDDKSPATLFLGVLKRANNITMERDRIIEYQDLRSRLEHRALEGLLFMHLRQGLDIRRVPPLCDKPDSGPATIADTARTEYCVGKDIQRLLSQIRTDLDSFSEVEADALMLSGYLATGKQVEKQQSKMPPGERWGGFDTPAYGNDDWPFLGMAAYICAPPGQQDATISARKADVIEQLDASSKLFAKFLYLRDGIATKSMPVLVFLVAATLLVGGVGWLASRLGYWLPIILLCLAALIPLTLMLFAKKPKCHQALQRLGELAVAIAVWPIAAAGLWLFNQRFLKRGSRKHLECIK